MKKKTSKAKRDSRRKNRSSEDTALNREFGSFGLEPPKVYRNNNRDPLADFDYTPRRSSRREDERTTKTPQERHKSQNEQRKKSKLKRKIIFYAALTLSICALVVVLSLTTLFKIHNINIEGNQVYSKKEISTVLPVQENASLFLTDIKAAGKKVEESLPYVYKAEVKRKLPSTITVTITETPKVFCINNGDKTYTYVDDKFKVLETNGAKIPTGGIEIKKATLTSKIVGQEAQFNNNKIKSNLSSLASAVTKLNIDKVTAIYSNDINNNYIVYDNRLTIKIGNLDNIDKKLYAAMSAIDKLNSNDPQAKGEIIATNDKQVYFTAK